MFRRFKLLRLHNDILNTNDFFQNKQHFYLFKLAYCLFTFNISWIFPPRGPMIWPNVVHTQAHNQTTKYITSTSTSQYHCYRILTSKVNTCQRLVHFQSFRNFLGSTITNFIAYCRSHTSTLSNNKLQNKYQHEKHWYRLLTFKINTRQRLVHFQRFRDFLGSTVTNFIG